MDFYKNKTRVSAGFILQYGFEFISNAKFKSPSQL